ncbi:MAG: hypothetical protein HZA51_04070 [Planctomycetes bacterium]|nr:hypothetical protein [Planctomycetota bacterium]
MAKTYLVRLTGLYFVLSAGTLSADVGVFAGTGHSLRQITTQSIALDSIDVTITPHRGRFLFDGSVTGMDEVDYKCRFVLRNLTSKRCSIQVGFPVDSQFAEPPKLGSATVDETPQWVADYRFIARDEKSTYHVKWQWWTPGAQKTTSRPSFFSNTQALFVWTMEFDASEVKTLDVQYQLPMSMTLALTSKRGIDPDDSGIDFRLTSMLGGSLLEFFGYTTQTGSSWSGNVGKASFTIVTKHFEQYLNCRALSEVDSSEHVDNERDSSTRMFFRLHTYWYRDIKPGGWQAIPEGIRWQHTDFKPNDPLEVRYYLTFFPRSAQDVAGWIDTVVHSGQDLEPPMTDEELGFVRQVLLAFFGQTPANLAVRRFVEDQIWYHPRSDFSLSQLSCEQQEILEALDKRLESIKLPRKD